MADDYPLGNLKFVSKGGVDEVFGMPIPKDLITHAIRNSEYYEKYLEMAARKPRQPTTMTGEVEKKKKAPKTDEEPQSASELQVEDDEYNLQRGIQMSLESIQAPIGRVVVHKPDPGFIRKLPEVEGKGKGIVFDEQAAQSLLDLQKPKKQSIKDQYIFQRRTPVTQDASTGPSAQPQDDISANVVQDTSSPADSTNDAETTADMGQSNSKNNTEIINQRDNNDELHEELTKSRKRRCDDQDPPPPPPKDSDRSKKKKHDYNVSASKHPLVQKSSTWKTFYSREAPSSSSKKKPASPSEQPVNDDLIPEDMHLSESEDTGAVHLPKIKTRLDWLKPLLEEETPETPEPDWVIPPNDLLDTENN
ncbi:hypothetical protein Tco_1167252 [Tanacetum coccineum]